MSMSMRSPYNEEYERAMKEGREDAADFIDRCPSCNEVIDYCQGHGEIGDPDGFAILAAHERDNHKNCHPAAECKESN